MSKKFVFRLVLCVSLALMAAFLSALGSKPATAQSWVLQWSDEFSGAANTGVNTGNWLYDTGTCYPGCPAGNWGTGEVESMTTSTSNVYQDGSGHLVIKPINSGGAWTSGRIETQRTDFQPPAGGIMAVEASIQQPNVSGAAAAGYWPAFWMLGAPFRGVYTNWPSIGEIDILEDINGMSDVFGTLHCGVDPGGPCNETTGLGSGAHGCGSCQSAFHTYRVEYDRSTSPQQIRWYLDGVNYFTVNANQVDATTWANATNHGFFIILNVAMGGAFPAAFGGGPTASTQSGVPMTVDYVRVYYSGGSGGATSTPVTPTKVGSTNTPVPTSSGGGGSGNIVYPLTGATTLSFTAGTSAGSDTIASAGGGNHDGTPTNQVTYTVSGVKGTYTGGATAFNLYVDAGTGVGDATQARISYDFTGDGTWDRVETYNYFATDPVVGWENYTQASNIKSSSGSFTNFSNGKIKLEVWNAIGNTSTSLRTSASSANGQQSSITIPFSGASGGGGGSPTNTPTFVPTRTNTPGSGPTATRTNTPVGATATRTTVPPTATNSGVAAWAPNTAYSIGQLVTYGGHTYKCIQAHTSEVGWEPPNVPALWSLVS